MVIYLLALFFVSPLRPSSYDNDEPVNAVNVMPITKMGAPPVTRLLLTKYNYFKKVGVCRNIKKPGSERTTLKHLIKNINIEIVASPPAGSTIFKQEDKAQRDVDYPKIFSSNHINIIHPANFRQLNPETVNNTY